MTIRVRLGPRAAAHLAFAYSPVYEALLSLHVVNAPKHHPVQHDWVRTSRDLPISLRRELDAIALTSHSYIPGFCVPSGDRAHSSFEAELESYLRIEPEIIKTEFSRCIDAATPPTARAAHPGLDDGSLRRRATAFARGAEVFAKLALDHPRHAVAHFAEVLEAYWTAAFRTEWARLEPHIAESVGAARATIAGGGVFDFLAALRPEVRLDRPNDTIIFDRIHHHEMRLGADQAMVLVPSYYVWPHVRVTCDEPWPLSVAYPVPLALAAARPPFPPRDLLTVLRALADENRLRILRLVAERPRSTQEMAPLIGMSEAGLSRGLQVLARAGLVNRERHGYYVLYSLNSERIDALPASVLCYLAPGSGSLAANQSRA